MDEKINKAGIKAGYIAGTFAQVEGERKNLSIVSIPALRGRVPHRMRVDLGAPCGIGKRRDTRRKEFRSGKAVSRASSAAKSLLARKGMAGRAAGCAWKGMEWREWKDYQLEDTTVESLQPRDAAETSRVLASMDPWRRLWIQAGGPGFTPSARGPMPETLSVAFSGRVSGVLAVRFPMALRTVCGTHSPF